MKTLINIQSKNNLINFIKLLPEHLIIIKSDKYILFNKAFRLYVFVFIVKYS